MLTPYWRALLAGMCGGADQHQLAVELIDDALNSVARRGERVWGAELHRLKGELLLALLGRIKSTVLPVMLSSSVKAILLESEIENKTILKVVKT